MEIICSVADRKRFIACGCCSGEDLACDLLQHNKHSRHILGVHGNIISAVKEHDIGESPANNYARFFVGFEHFAGCCTANTSHANIKNTREKETVRYQNDYLFLPSVMQLSDFKQLQLICMYQ